MANKDLFHEQDISVPTFAGAGPQINCTDMAAVNAQWVNGMDTSGSESNMIVLFFADKNASPVYDVQMYENDTSAATLGTAVAATDVLVRRDDNVNTECPAATGLLRMGGNTAEDHFYIFQYIGTMRYVKLVFTAGGGDTPDSIPGMMFIQGRARHGPVHI